MTALWESFAAYAYAHPNVPVYLLLAAIIILPFAYRRRP